jgi:hypothetical protein
VFNAVQAYIGRVDDDPIHATGAERRSAQMTDFLLVASMVAAMLAANAQYLMQ